MDLTTRERPALWKLGRQKHRPKTRHLLGGLSIFLSAQACESHRDRNRWDFLHYCVLNKEGTGYECRGCST